MPRPLLPLPLALVACAETGPGPIGEDYAFESRFDAEDSVAYDGQVFRHLLIEATADHIGGLTARIDAGWTPAPGDVAAEIEFYLAFDSETSGAQPHGLAFDPAALQTTWDEVSTGKDLLGKIAGNDEVGQHEDWSTAFAGASAGVTTPESQIRAWIQEIDDAAVARAAGTLPTSPEGAPLPVHVTADGRNLEELVAKLLRGSIAFSQGADDYLDDDEAGKGLLSDHEVAEDGANHTALEHAWDEGFGYFGAARSYGDWTDDEIAAGALDVDGDGAIDLLAEVSYGHSGNAAKRDLGAVAPTDLTADAWRAFYEGRALITSWDGNPDDAGLAELVAHRDAAMAAWGASIAASAVHYVNDVLKDQATVGTDAYDFEGHAKHWSELKGFALSLQFDPRSPLTDEQQVALHALLGDGPVLGDADARAAYAADLVEARALIGAAFGFDTANLGDDDGQNGW
jgi:hypothetical protein